MIPFLKPHKKFVLLLLIALVFVPRCCRATDFPNDRPQGHGNYCTENQYDFSAFSHPYTDKYISRIECWADSNDIVRGLQFTFKSVSSGQEQSVLAGKISGGQYAAQDFEPTDKINAVQMKSGNRIDHFEVSAPSGRKVTCGGYGGSGPFNFDAKEETLKSIAGSWKIHNNKGEICTIKFTFGPMLPPPTPAPSPQPTKATPAPTADPCMAGTASLLEQTAGDYNYNVQPKTVGSKEFLDYSAETTANAVFKNNCEGKGGRFVQLSYDLSCTSPTAGTKATTVIANPRCYAMQCGSPQNDLLLQTFTIPVDEKRLGSITGQTWSCTGRLTSAPSIPTTGGGGGGKGGGGGGGGGVFISFVF
jgi:hypothetical protein